MAEPAGALMPAPDPPTDTLLVLPMQASCDLPPKQTPRR
jgi:hypothetical protein